MWVPWFFVKIGWVKLGADQVNPPGPARVTNERSACRLLPSGTFGLNTLHQNIRGIMRSQRINLKRDNETPAWQCSAALTDHCNFPRFCINVSIDFRRNHVDIYITVISEHSLHWQSSRDVKNVKADDRRGSFRNLLWKYIMCEIPATIYVPHLCIVLVNWQLPREWPVYSGDLRFITTWSALVINQITQFMALKPRRCPPSWFCIYIKWSYSDHLGCGLLLRCRPSVYLYNNKSNIVTPFVFYIWLIVGAPGILQVK